MINRVLFFLLLLLVVLSPLPLGSNREWSWALCSLWASVVTLAWVAANLGRSAQLNAQLQPLIPLLFLLACSWILVQAGTWTPDGWHHPLWQMTADTLGAEIAGRVTLSLDDSATALMRLLAYGLVFLLALQFGRDRGRAQLTFGVFAVAGLAYAGFGLAVYWGGYEIEWLFGGRQMPHDVRSTFINRNHYATWQGLSLLCTFAWIYHRVAKPTVKPYAVPQDREEQVVDFILKVWKPLTVLLLMVSALLLSHSRGGFASTMAATIVLLVLLDRRAKSKKTRMRLAAVSVMLAAGIAFLITSEALLDRINRTESPPRNAWLCTSTSTARSATIRCSVSVTVLLPTATCYTTRWKKACSMTGHTTPGWKTLSNWVCRRPWRFFWH